MIAASREPRVVLAKEQMSCDLAGEVAIVNLKNGVYYGLDAMGARVWSLLRQPITVPEICDSLIRDFDVEKPRLESDIRGFINELVEQGLVDVTS
jgi:hypothetical protein